MRVNSLCWPTASPAIFSPTTISPTATSSTPGTSPSAPNCGRSIYACCASWPRRCAAIPRRSCPMCAPCWKSSPMMKAPGRHLIGLLVSDRAPARSPRTGSAGADRCLKETGVCPERCFAEAIARSSARTSRTSSMTPSVPLHGQLIRHSARHDGECACVRWSRQRPRSAECRAFRNGEPRFRETDDRRRAVQMHRPRRRSQIFADGVTEELTTMLSRMLGLFLIARDSALRFKDRPSAAHGRRPRTRRALRAAWQCADELPIAFAFMPIFSTPTAALKCGRSAMMCPVAMSSAFRTRSLRNVVRALQVELLDGEQARIWHHSTTSLEAWSCLTQGLSLLQAPDEGRCPEGARDVRESDGHRSRPMPPPGRGWPMRIGTTPAFCGAPIRRQRSRGLRGSPSARARPRSVATGSPWCSCRDSRAARPVR